MTRHEKKKYYEELRLNGLKYFDEVNDFDLIQKYNEITQNLASENYGFISNRSEERLVSKFYAFNNLSNKFYADSKLSALKNGFLRTVNRIDESFINNEKKKNLLSDMTNIYYDKYQQLSFQIQDTASNVIRYFVDEWKDRDYTNINLDRLEYEVLSKTRKIKIK